MGSTADNRAVWYLPVHRILESICLCAVLLRLYSRAFLTRSLGSDDFAIVIAAVRRSTVVEQGIVSADTGHRTCRRNR